MNKMYLIKFTSNKDNFSDRILNLMIFSLIRNVDLWLPRWGQEEEAGVKENEIQIVTLEKQKDTYQVISPKN